MITAIFIISGLIILVLLYIAIKNNENSTLDLSTMPKRIDDFSYDEIRRVIDKELTKVTSKELEKIIRYNNLKNISNLDKNEISENLSIAAKNGKKIYPTYLEKNLEFILNGKYS